MERLADTRMRLCVDLKECEYLLIGLGEEWARLEPAQIPGAYESLRRLAQGKDYFVVTTVTDGRIFESPLDGTRITAPCGNRNWLQGSCSCTKDIWERGELPSEICPHCGAPLTENTIAAQEYIEEGYLPQWNAYKAWLAGTLNRRLLILELGVGFGTPTVIRWPFEKTAFFNRKAHMYRVNQTFYQISEQIRERAEAVEANSVEFCREMIENLSGI